MLVEVDEIANLNAAYPNYFGDVDVSKTELSEAVGEERVEFVLGRGARKEMDEAMQEKAVQHSQ